MVTRRRRVILRRMLGRAAMPPMITPLGALEDASGLSLKPSDGPYSNSPAIMGAPSPKSNRAATSALRFVIDPSEPDRVVPRRLHAAGRRSRARRPAESSPALQQKWVAAKRGAIQPDGKMVEWLHVEMVGKCTIAILGRDCSDVEPVTSQQ